MKFRHEAVAATAAITTTSKSLSLALIVELDLAISPSLMHYDKLGFLFLPIKQEISSQLLKLIDLKILIFKKLQLPFILCDGTDLSSIEWAPKQ